MPLSLQKKNMVYKSHRQEKDSAQISSLQKRLNTALELIRDLRDNWDCDEDAHKYGTGCRACSATELLKTEKYAQPVISKTGISNE